MRSIHKKPLKRLLSTVLAIAMVLSLMPATVFALPAATVTLEQSGLKATITPSEPAAVTVGNTSTVTYGVTIEATNATADDQAVTLIIDGTNYDFGNVTITGSAITGTVSMPAGLALSGDKISGTVTKNYAPGDHTVEMSLAVGALGSVTETPTITVPRKADLTLTVPTPAVTAGEDFTVTATSDVAGGRVQFEYNGSKQSVEVIPMLDGSGYAEYTFKAVAGETEVKATQFGMSGGVVNSDVKTANITVNAADTYYDVTFLPGAADAYIPFSPTTVSVKSGESYPLPTAIPTREGYTFKGWDKNGDGTADYPYNGSTYTTSAVDPSADMTLNAVWKETKYAINYSIYGSSAADYTTPKTAAAAVGETVYFGVTVPDGYDASTMRVVVENTIVLAPYNSISGTGNTIYYYSFVLTQNMARGGSADVVFTGPSKLTYTVMMPVGHFTAKITAANGTDITPAASASVEYGKGYTFTVTPATGYEIKGVYVNGAAQTAASGTGTTQTYTVTNVTSAQTVEVVVDEIPSYTVTYVVNDAQYTTQKVTSGSTIGTLPDDPVVEGYTFTAWYTKQNGSGTKLATTTTVSQDMTVYAKLTPVSYTITYKDGTSVLDTQTKTHGVASSLSADVPTKAGHTFLGWGTTAAATTATYQPGDMYSTEGSITLYAVWKIDTFTVTLPNGTGYTAMPATGSSSPVDYGKNFTFTVTVDPEYAVTKPTVKVGNTDVTNSLSGSNPYTYTINNITADQVVSIQVTRNPVYTVTFQYTLPGSSTPTVYQTQQVEYGAKATQPAPPSVEGYTFGGWYNGTTAYDFATPVTDNLTLTAKMTAITPKVEWTASGTGWTLDVTNPSTLTSGGTVAYKSSVEFTVTIAAGYDATNLAVAANGLALAPVEVNGNIYKFVLPNITADQKITVTGVARKMITITYNDNGGIGGPGQEQVPMYVDTLTDNGTITSATPSRVGYTFAKWNTKADGTGTDYAAGVNNTFTADTTLYAVWSAKATTVTLTVDKDSQYEGENVTLTADVKSGAASVTSGSVQFYRSNNSATPAELVGTAKVSGGKAVLTIATSAYKHGTGNTDSYTVKFIPDEGSGYSKADATAEPDPVTVRSAAISWKLTGDNIDTDGNKLTIKNSGGTEVDSMTAGQVYTLELPAIYALDNQTTALVVNKDYKVTWQFRNASGTWTDYTAAAGADSVKILAAYSKYVFRAVVTPLTGATGHFTKAAKYETTGALTADQYEAYLVTAPTAETVQQETATTLEVKDTHDITVGTPAEFEGQKVTLTATVTLTGTNPPKVTTGEVYFYKVGSSDTLIGKANVQSDGTAVLEATMSTYSAGASDVFKAVYQENATYETSTSSNESVLIRSTAIAWAKDTSGAEVKTLTVNPNGSIYADNKYTLTLPTIKEEGQDVTLAVGTDYVVSWYMVKADNTVELLAENTESNTYTVVPPTAGVTYYAVVSPKAGSNYTDAYEGTTTKNFLTSDETAASVKAPTITTITFGDVKTDTDKTPDFSQYEQKTITITAKVVEAKLDGSGAKNPEEVVKSGTVTFYVVTKNDGTYEKIGTATVSNGLATVSYKLPEFALNDDLSNIEYFFAVYSDTADTYADSNTTTNLTTIADSVDANLLDDTDGINKDTEAVQILSTTISWKIDSTNKIVADPDANKLKVYTADANGNKGTEVSDGKMTAGSSYVLQLPAVYALDDAKSASPTALTVNKDYTVVWQYREFGASDWNNYPNASAGNTVLITPDYSGYQFQAVVTPVYDNEHLTGYKTAAAYTNDVATGKTNSLVTDPTEKTELQATTTDLAITGAVEEAANQVLFGETKFGWGNHLVQYENQTVTLKATVTDNATSLGVNSVGKVYFYRYTNDSVDNNDVLLNANGQGIEVGPDGIATMNYTMPAYDSTKVASAEENCSRIYAVYVEGVTYDTSASVSFTTDTPGVKTYGKPNSGLKNMVFSMSTTIKTPIIDSTRANADGKTATTYTADLTGLLAGVSHTFTLRTGNAAADWSVVALDGREVASSNYDIQWNVKTGDNTVTDATVGGTFVTTDNKVGDEISVTLSPKGDMTRGETSDVATSKKAIIGTKQDVNVTVTASDEIASTTGVTDVYQLNEITLTATVTAKESDATVKPSGTVTFYYSVNGTAWTKVGETTDLAEDAGVITASIKTTELPVDATTNKQQNVTITAIYSGDETFNKSGTIDTNSAITDTTGCTVTDETVTVYSSVVYVNSGVENVASNTVGQDHTSGIYIYAEEDKVLANETNVNLKLSDVYTLDHNIDLSKLAYGVDYTVQWQKLTNAAAYSSNYASEKAVWKNIDGATGVTCQINVEQGAAYRAMITVKDTPIAKGSYTFVDQGTVGTTDIKDGRLVYYSNVLVANPAPPTVTVNVNTDKTGDGFEGIVQGETVTIHTFASGATGTTPISELTVTITDANGDVVNEQVKTNVNGHVSFDWAAADPGYYTLKVVAKFTNGYSDKEITRTLIVRDDNYDFTVSNTNPTYNGKAQGLTVDVNNMGIENALAQKSVVVYYYDKDGKQVEPTQAGTYKAVIRLQESAYWTEKTMDTTFTIEQREVEIDDVIVQAKVYNGSDSANIQEIILNDAETAQTTTGLPTGTTGIINGDSVYAVGTAVTNSANVNEANSVTVTVTLPLLGDDAANYKLVNNTYTEAFNIQRSQVKGEIADSTYKYTGSNITVPADDIYLIDQAGNEITSANYTVTYYYHNGDGVEKVDAMNKLGKYTVIARPEQNNYKGGASETVYVVSDNAVDKDPDTTAKSALIDITNTVKLFDGTATGVTVTATKGNVTSVTYNGSTTVPSAAGRYLVKVTTDTGDTAYGIYTIVKANPVLALSATGAEYTSAQISGTPELTYNGSTTFPAGTYYTYTGGTIQGVAYEAPTEVGTYIVTAHVPETDNYTTHEISDQFKITPKALTITADSLQRRQYGAFPDMTASFDGLATGGVAADTSLRDVQIQPELIFNETDGYDNIAMDHVGNEYPIIAIAALARNYDVSYVNGNLSVTRDEPNPYLAIHGMIDNGNGGDIAYYGDVIQLYAYGSQSETGVINNSSVLTWSVTGPATITQDGLLTITGVGTVEVKLTRGVGAQKISTTLTIDARKQEVKVEVPNVDLVYTGADRNYSGVGTPKAIDAKLTDVAVSDITVANNVRGVIGSQIVTGKVADTVALYQSETYGGLFTINDAEIVVAPKAVSTTYGTAATMSNVYDTGYTETTRVAGGTAALTGAVVASIADAYSNLDVGTYEILVAGAEDMNYNVKYLTNPGADKVTVNALGLTVSTGTLNNNIALTSGSLNPLGNYPANGAEVASTAALGAANVRMYGEPNWVMDYALATLISGDSLADLDLDLEGAPLGSTLVDFSYNIAGHASVTYPNPNTAIDASQYPGYTIPAANQQVVTNATWMNLVNYTENYVLGTQNIYQRPVELKCTISDANKELPRSTSKTALDQILIQNITAGKLGGEGGLATLLKHTIANLDLKITYQFSTDGGATWTPAPADFDKLTGYNKVKATISVGNPDYYAAPIDVVFTVSPTRYIIEIVSFGQSSASVNLYEYNEETDTKTLTWFPADSTLAAGSASTAMTCKIYNRVDGATKYADYAYETPVVDAKMLKGYTIGNYTISYSALVGSFRMFAIADGYIIIDNTN